MEAKFPSTKLASIEEEVRLLKAKLAASKRKRGRSKKFSSLEGIWKGKADFSFEEIKQAEIKLKEES
mgnify:CR=1 FL=1